MSATEQSHAPMGELAQAYCGVSLPLLVMRSRAGWYLGTHGGEHGVEKEDILPYEPVSRESEYFATEGEADTALRTGRWTQRTNP